MSSQLQAVEVHQQRIALASIGYAVGRARKDKSPVELKGWMDSVKQRDYAFWSDPANYPRNDALNTLIVLSDGVLALDIDIDHDASLVGNVIQLAMALLGETKVIRRRPNSNRAMIFYRITDYKPQQSYKTVKGPQKCQVELRTGAGKYALVYGEHAEGGLYCWDQELKTTPLVALKTVTYADVKLFREQLAGMLGEIASRMVMEPNTETSQAQYLAMPSFLVNALLRERQHDYALNVLRKVCDELQGMRNGDHRNTFLTKEAFNMGTMRDWFSGNEAPQALYAAAVQCGYAAKKGDDYVRGLIGRQWERGCAATHRVWDELTFTVGGKPISEALGSQRIRLPKAALAKPPASRGVVLRMLDDVEDTPIEWHWKGYLPAGLLTLLCGAGGTGKSTIAFGIAATLTTGGTWPDGTHCTVPGNVLVWSSEDDVSNTIKPRLRAAGADLSKIAMIEGEKDSDNYPIPFDPATDMDGLRAKVRSIGGIALLIIDPIVSAVSGDMYKPNDVRRGLNPIVEFAKEFGCAVIGISHFSKNTTGRNATERVIGSQAFGALARMVLVAALDADTKEGRFTRAKTNISSNGGGFSYIIQVGTVPARDGRMIETTRIVWGASLEGSAESILHEVEGDDASHSGRKIDDAVHFLIRTLEHGPVAANDVTQQAITAGISKQTLRRARESINITPRKADFSGHWMWALQSQKITPLDWIREREK